MQASPCARCGSQRVVPDAKLHNFDENSRPLMIEVARANPVGRFVIKKTESGEVRASLCGDCGAVTMFAPEAAALYAAYVGED